MVLRGAGVHQVFLALWSATIAQKSRTVGSNDSSAIEQCGKVRFFDNRASRFVTPRQQSCTVDRSGFSTIAQCRRSLIGYKLRVKTDNEHLILHLAGWHRPCTELTLHKPHSLCPRAEVALPKRMEREAEEGGALTRELVSSARRTTTLRLLMYSSTIRPLGQRVHFIFRITCLVSCTQSAAGRC